MGEQNPVIDWQIFTRAASTFALKRETLAPETVEALASDIVRRLSRHVQKDAQFREYIVSETSVAAFCDTLARDNPDAALKFIDDRLAEGISREEVYLGYIAAAAEVLGRRWDEDLMSFVDVAVATGHLYALMRAMRGLGASFPPVCDRSRRALFATVPGEDHGIGITIASDLFREAGWEINLQVGRSHEDLMLQVETTLPLVIGLSLSTDLRIAELVRLVVAIRVTVPRAIIGVAPGSGLGSETLTQLADIDLVFGDVRSALVDLDRMIRVQKE